MGIDGVGIQNTCRCAETNSHLENKHSQGIKSFHVECLQIKNPHWRFETLVLLSY